MKWAKLNVPVAADPKALRSSSRPPWAQAVLPAPGHISPQSCPLSLSVSGVALPGTPSSSLKQNTIHTRNSLQLK